MIKVDEKKGGKEGKKERRGGKQICSCCPQVICSGGLPQVTPNFQAQVVASSSRPKIFPHYRSLVSKEGVTCCIFSSLFFMYLFLCLLHVFFLFFSSCLIFCSSRLITIAFPSLHCIFILSHPLFISFPYQIFIPRVKL